MTLKHLRSSTADKRPQASGMAEGQLAINTASGSPGLFFKDSASNLVKVGPVHVGSGAPNASPASGGTSGNSLGEQWLDTSGGTYVFKIWDGSAWRSEAGEFVNTTGDTMTGALGIIAGSASTPGLFFSGDANSGLYSPGADQVAISTNGTGRLFVDASGTVKAGTSGDPTLGVFSRPPMYIKQLSDPADGYGGLQIEAFGETSLLGIGYDGTAQAFTLETSYRNTGGFRPIRFKTSNSERLRITSAGLVGVGTSSPDNKLSVGIASADEGVELKATYNGARVARFGLVNPGVDNTPYIGSVAGNDFGFITSNTRRMTLDASGRLGVGTTSPAASLDVNGNIYGRGEIASFNGSTVGGIITTTAAGRLSIASYNATGSDRGEIIFQRNNTGGNVESARIDSSGRVGIGTSSPGAKLDVSGDVIVNGGGVQFPIQFANAFTPNSQRADLLFTANATSNNALRVGTIASNGGVTLQGTRQSDSSQKVNLVLNPDGGSVGIGTTTALSTLVVSNGSNKNIEFQPGSTSYLFAYDRTANDYLDLDVSGQTIRFSTDNGTERARIDSSGRLLIGTSSTSGVAKLQVQGYVGDNTGVGLVELQAGSATPTSGTGLGRIDFSDNASRRGAVIAAERDGGTWSASSQPGRLVFSTTADGASSPTERMRIGANGAVAIGTTDTATGYRVNISSANGLRVEGWGAGVGVGVVLNTTVSTTSTAISFGYSATEVGKITTTSTATAYVTSSDYRLKENVVAVTDGITRLQQLKPSRFNFIADPDKTVDGFLAHEVQDVVPEAIAGTKDEVDDDGNPVYQGIDQSKLVPLLTAALQEAIGEIESLKARVASLESA